MEEAWGAGWGGSGRAAHLPLSCWTLVLALDIPSGLLCPVLSLGFLCAPKQGARRISGRLWSISCRRPPLHEEVKWATSKGRHLSQSLSVPRCMSPAPATGPALEVSLSLQATRSQGQEDKK